MTQNDGGTPYEPKPDPETPPTQPLPDQPTQPLPEPPLGAGQQPASATPQEPAPAAPQEPVAATPQEPPAAGAPGPAAPGPGAPAAYGQPGAPGAPQYGYAPTPPKNDLGVWSLVSGILSFMVCPLLLGIAAIITGTMSRRAADEGLANNRGMGTAGLILGWVNIALVVIGIVFFIIALAVGLFAGGMSGWDNMNDPNNWNY